MRKHGWQLPYHPLQVVAVAVFLALGFAFYVFFAPFVGNKFFQYAAMGIYTPLIVSVFSLYIWSAAADPADPGVFKSKKYLKVKDNKKQINNSQSQQGGEATSSIQDANAGTDAYKGFDKGDKDVKSKVDSTSECAEKKTLSMQTGNLARFVFLPCACFSSCSRAHEESSEQQTSEDGMFYCSLCEVEVLKYSKHCRVCDKCVNRFDHHCRWLNNCIGRKNYRKFFALMVSAILLLVFQWSIGILVLICCFLEKKKFSSDITTKLGSSFTIVPYAIVVAVCTILAMIATLPLAQLFFFHILLIKKGISTYDYIIALREQEQGNGGQQSPQMSSVSSLTGLSSASSFNNFQRAARCTPPRLFLDDQFDVVNPETGSVSSQGKKTMLDEPVKKKNTAPVKISPWTLARMNADEVSKAAAEARKKSKILQPVTRQEARYSLETESSYSSSGRRMGGPGPRLDNNNKKRSSKRIRLPAELSHEPLTTISREGAEISMRHMMTDSFRTYVPPLQLETRGSFMPRGSVPNAAVNLSSSPESSLDSPEVHPFGVSGTEEIRRLVGLSAIQKETPLSRSTSDGYDASGGEDSDRVPPRIIPRSSNWSNVLFGSEQEFSKFNVSSSSVQDNTRK